jgi:hypothetical protein
MPASGTYLVVGPHHWRSTFDVHSKPAPLPWKAISQASDPGSGWSPAGRQTSLGRLSWPATTAEEVRP